MDEGLAREFALFREALALPTVGVHQVGELEVLRSLVRRYPEQARAYLAELISGAHEPGGRNAEDR
jgi:hypothetical protein